MNTSFLISIYMWKHRMLYVGPSYGPCFRRYGSAALIVGLDRPFKAKTLESEEVVCQTLLIPPQKAICIDTQKGRRAIFFLDIYRQDFWRLSKCASYHVGNLGCELTQEKACVSALKALSESPDPEQARGVLSLLGLPLSPLDDPVKPVDPRVIEALCLMRQGTLSNCSPTTEIARQLYLSVPRVIQLFRQNLGVGVGTVQCWCRLYRTAIAIASGTSLVRAALDSGFTDQAHFCNTFKRMIGLKPSLFFSNQVEVSFFTDPQLLAVR